MEVLRTIGSVMGSIKMLIDHRERNTAIQNEVAHGLKSMKDDFALIAAFLRGKQTQLEVPPEIQSLLQELAYQIDDFIQDVRYRGACHSYLLSTFGADPRPPHIQCSEYFKEHMKKLKEGLMAMHAGQSEKKDDLPIHAAQSSSDGSPIPYAPEGDLVGIEGPKKEILDLLSSRVVGRLSVISIVGCSGSGKTALARVLYQDDDVTQYFDFKSWVVASDKSWISSEVVPTSASAGSTSEALNHFQNDKRYLIFVDDLVQETPLKDIKEALSENNMGSRIIVSTRVPSIVRDYSSGSFEYTMQGLDQETSRELFRRKFWAAAVYTPNDLNIIVDKCDGLPIALISAAELLRSKGQRPERIDFETVSKELGEGLACTHEEFKAFEGITTFAEMRRARVEPYENLLNNGEKLCLVYVSMFPYGHQIISKNLVRRLIAEGFVTGENSDSAVGDARECVRKLLEQHMIEPVPARNYSNVAKRCRVHSIMLQFTIKKAVSRNFLGRIHKGDLLRGPTSSFVGVRSVPIAVRRLTVQYSPLVRGSDKRPHGMDLSLLRSLAIFESTILDLRKCNRVRVLDLEDCDGLTPTDLDNICVLKFLKYLSLRNTVIPEAKLPRNMKNLLFLETLDTRGTRYTEVIKLPIQVLTLPRLAYLFGKFELTNLKQQNAEKLTDFFSKESELHTLGGIAVHDEKGLEIVLLALQHATKLKKVKVWFMNTPAVEPSVLVRFMQRFNRPSTRLLGRFKPSSAGPEANPIGRNTHKDDDPAPATCTPPGQLPCAGQLAADSSSNVAEDPAPTTSATPGPFPSSAGPSVYSISKAHDPTPATSTPEPTPGATGPAAGLSTGNWNTHLKPNKSKRTRTQSLFKRSYTFASNPTSNAAQDPAPTTCTPVTGGIPGLPSAGPGPSSADCSTGGNTPEPAPATCTPLASDTQELIQCAIRLTRTLEEHHGKLESLSIDFNGVSNTFLKFLEINGTISSIKLRRAQKDLPVPAMLGNVCNLKKLHLFSTGLTSKNLADLLQHLKCLQKLKLQEEGHGLWDSGFHVEASGFISLIWLCFESSKLRSPALKIDQGVTTPLASLLLLCKEPHLPVKDYGLHHLAKLNEVILHPSATDSVVTEWKIEAEKNINRPYVQKKQV